MAIQLLHGVNYTPSCIYVRTRRTLISQSGRTDLFRLSRIANNKQECAGRLKTTLVFANDLIVPFDTVAQNVRGITQSTDAGLGDHLWAAVFTFNPYLLISLNEIIDINNSFIDINKYGHSIHLY